MVEDDGGDLEVSLETMYARGYDDRIETQRCSLYVVAFRDTRKDKEK
jgi:hypothetical protein